MNEGPSYLSLGFFPDFSLSSLTGWLGCVGPLYEVRWNNSLWALEPHYYLYSLSLFFLQALYWITTIHYYVFIRVPWITTFGTEMELSLLRGQRIRFEWARFPPLLFSSHTILDLLFFFPWTSVLSPKFTSRHLMVWNLMPLCCYCCRQWLLLHCGSLSSCLRVDTYIRQWKGKEM